MGYYATPEVHRAVNGQLASFLSDAGVDDFVRFDGSLAQAVSSHFGQGVKAGASLVVFSGITESIPETVSGDGLPIRMGEVIDIYVILRITGRANYEAQVDRLYAVSDMIAYDCFKQSNKRQGYIDRVHANIFQFRRIATVDDPAYSGHLIRFIFKPAIDHST